MLGAAAQPIQSSANVPLIRGSMIMVSPPHQGSTAPVPQQETATSAPTQPLAYAATSRPPLKRALSSPAHKKPVEPCKRQYSSYSQGDYGRSFNLALFIILRDSLALL